MSGSRIKDRKTIRALKILSLCGAFALGAAGILSCIGWSLLWMASMFVIHTDRTYLYASSDTIQIEPGVSFRLVAEPQGRIVKQSSGVPLFINANEGAPYLIRAVFYCDTSNAVGGLGHIDDIKVFVDRVSDTLMFEEKDVGAITLSHPYVARQLQPLLEDMTVDIVCRITFFRDEQPKEYIATLENLTISERGWGASE